MRSCIVEMDQEKNKTVWIRFCVYKTPRTMIKAIERVADDGISRSGYNAACVSTRDYSTEKTPILIFLNEKQLGAGIVAHEITHALFNGRLDVIKALVKRRTSTGHEIVADFVGETTRMFWDWYLDNPDD